MCCCRRYARSASMADAEARRGKRVLSVYARDAMPCHKDYMILRLMRSARQMLRVARSASSASADAAFILKDARWLQRAAIMSAV